jgi:hypothetical protein
VNTDNTEQQMVGGEDVRDELDDLLVDELNSQPRPGDYTDDEAHEAAAANYLDKLGDNIMQLISRHCIAKKAVADAVPKSFRAKMGTDVGQLWGSADATDGYNEALRDVRQALSLGEQDG